MLLREEGVLHDRVEGATWPRWLDVADRRRRVSHARIFSSPPPPISQGLWYVEELGHDVVHYLDFPEKATLRGISADYRFGKVYFCESTAGKVYMVKADDATSVEVVAEIPGAFDVVIDVVTTGDAITSMYVSSPTDNCIYKARIEGSDVVGVKKFVHAAGIRSLDLSGNTTLFWVSAGSIYSVNLPSGVMARTVATNFVELTDIAADRAPEASG